MLLLFKEGHWKSECPILIVKQFIGLRSANASAPVLVMGHLQSLWGWKKCHCQEKMTVKLNKILVIIYLLLSGLFLCLEKKLISVNFIIYL